jgi:hypothetical protein
MRAYLAGQALAGDDYQAETRQCSQSCHASNRVLEKELGSTASLEECAMHEV